MQVQLNALILKKFIKKGENMDKFVFFENKVFKKYSWKLFFVEFKIIKTHCLLSILVLTTFSTVAQVQPITSDLFAGTVVQFFSNGTNLLAGEREKIARTTAAFGKSTSIENTCVTVNGYSDSSEGQEIRQFWLSRKRAATVVKLLLRNGFLEDHIYPSSKGSSQPVVKLGDIRNARVEIQLHHC